MPRWTELRRSALPLAAIAASFIGVAGCESQRCAGPQQTPCEATDPAVWIGVVRDGMSYLHGPEGVPAGAADAVARWRANLAQTGCLAPDHAGVVDMLDALGGPERVEVVFSFPSEGPACGLTRQVNFLVEKHLSGWSVSVMRYPTAAPVPSVLSEVGAE